MENISKYVSSILFIAGCWDLGNGLLHDIFVLRSEHGKQYDRNLLRLLMDGHILITCGIILMITAKSAEGFFQAHYVAAVALVSMIVYCLMIFPFLKSIVTLVINSAALAILIISFIKK